MRRYGTAICLTVILSACGGAATTSTTDSADSSSISAIAVIDETPTTLALLPSSSTTEAPATTTSTSTSTSTTTTIQANEPVTAASVADSLLSLSTSTHLRMIVVQTTSDVIESNQPQIKDTFESATRTEIGRIGDDYYSLTRSTLFGGYDIWSRDGIVVAQLDGEDPVQFVHSESEGAIATELEFISKMVRSSTIEIIDQSHSSALVRLTCAENTDISTSGTVRMWCSDSSTVLLTIRLRDGFVESAEIEGPLALYPGLVFMTQARISYSTDVELDPNAPFDTADSAPLECVAEKISVDINDGEALAVYVSENTTESNRELFQDCGFAIWPPGQDLHG